MQRPFPKVKSNLGPLFLSIKPIKKGSSQYNRERNERPDNGWKELENYSSKDLENLDIIYQQGVEEYMCELYFY